MTEAIDYEMCHEAAQEQPDGSVICLVCWRVLRGPRLQCEALDGYREGSPRCDGEAFGLAECESVLCGSGQHEHALCHFHGGPDQETTA